MANGQDPLGSYRGRRDFERTPEPPAARKRRSRQPRFVVHQHDATTLHYDFRLEAAGVLKSWAVPKGPSTNPKEKRLAVPTEDHPLDYADYEGLIPEGQYGAGPVIVWDAGTYRSLTEEHGKPVAVKRAVEDGHVAVWLEGRKLRGGYALTRIGKGKRERWLLVKMADEAADARRKPVKSEPGSVLSGRTVDDVAALVARGRGAGGMSAHQAAPADGGALADLARSWPAVSVVVPTRGRAESVARLLATLTAAGARYPGEAEVVVSDASTGADRDRIRRVAAEAGARVVRGPAGIGAQRNRGWRTARGELVVFVDSDCSATPGLLSALVAAFADRPVTAVAGRVRFAGPRSLPLNAAVATGVVAAFDGFGKQAGERIPWAATANLAVRRAALVAVGGFDERLPAGEDVDLGLRLSQLGELRYAPDALVEHHTETWDGVAEAAVRFFRYGRADAHLRRAHPAVRGGVEPSVLPALLLALAAAAWRTARGRPHPAAPVTACLLSLAGTWVWAGWRARPHGATAVLALALMECLSAGRAVEAVRLGRWGDVLRGVVLDEAQREREAGRRRGAWLAAVVPGIAVMVAAGGARWRRSWC